MEHVHIGCLVRLIFLCTLERHLVGRTVSSHRGTYYDGGMCRTSRTALRRRCVLALGVCALDGGISDKLVDATSSASVHQGPLGHHVTAIFPGPNRRLPTCSMRCASLRSGQRRFSPAMHCSDGF